MISEEMIEAVRREKRERDAMRAEERLMILRVLYRLVLLINIVCMHAPDTHVTHSFGLRVG